MRKIFLCAAMAGLMFTACTQNPKTAEVAQSAENPTLAANAQPADATNAPAMKFEKVTHDFGKIKSGDKVTWQFKFTNSGKSPLIIKDAVATCGCTKPEWPTAPVQPGADGVIKVTFDSAGKMGLQDKQITITANTNPAQNMVHLIGEVETK